jgi:phosphoribosylamine--glycine ligase
MGAYSPARVLDAATLDRAMREILAPAARGLEREGTPFRGVLFAGLMIENGAPRLIEFNARFGDPECQALMLRLESDLLDYLYAAATGGLGALPAPRWSNEAAIGVVLAAGGYPDRPEAGARILGLQDAEAEGALIFQAGTARDADGALRVAGGRVLTVCARGADLAAARRRAYAAVDKISLPGGFHRRDIGWRAL